MPLFRGALALLVALAIGACTTDDDVGTGLLDGSSGSTATAGDLIVKILGPNDSPSGSFVIDAGCEQTGFVVEVTDARGRAVPDVFVSIEAADGGQINTASRDNSGGVTTNSQGRGAFRFVAPEDIIDTTDVALVASVTIDDEQSDEQEYTVTVVPGPPPELVIVSPQTTSPAEVSAGDLLRGFDARLDPGNSCRDDADRFITFSLSPEQGFINAPPDEENSGGGLTGSTGRLRFDYQAPDVVTAALTITVTGEATIAGQTDTATARIRVLPPELDITGPRDASPGRPRSGYRATLLRSDGTAIQDERIMVTAARGTVADESNSGESFTTDAFGRVNFSFTPPDNITEDTVVTLSAEAQTQLVSDQFDVTVRPETFLFVAPESGTPIPVGVDNAEPLSFSWREAASVGGAAVEGTVRLTTDSNDALFVVNDDPQNPVDTVVVDTDSGGDFANPVSVYSNASEFVTITARDDNSTRRTTTLTVQFVDQPSSSPDQLFLNATPLEIETSTTTRNSSDLEFIVHNDANQPVAGQDVTFNLAQAASGDNLEEIFPGGGTTDGNGSVRSEYFSGRTAGTATVRACVVSNGACETIDIRVVEPTP